MDRTLFSSLLLDLLTLGCVLNANANNVSISTGNHTGPMIEDREYELRCDVPYVARVRVVSVNWYKGKTLLRNSTTELTKQVLDKTQMIFSDRQPISLKRTENGTPYTCEGRVKRNLEEDFVTVGTSAPLYITVHYKPVINTVKLPPFVPVFRGYPEVLVCEAEGFPQPTITWTTKPHTKVEAGNLTIMEVTNENVGEYTCNASNSVDSTVITVKVVLKEDYLPLIAGFVALVVMITSVLFVVIYSIYYKNTKMGRYMVEGAKSNPHDRNIAQNGKDNSIPMKALSQNIFHM